MQEAPTKSRLGRWWTRTSFWLSLVIVAILVALAAVLVIRNHGDKTGANAPAAPSPPAVPSSAAVPKGYAALPAPTGMTNGYPTKYPHTPEGAAAVLAGYITVTMTTLSYDEMQTAVNAYVQEPVSESHAQQAAGAARSVWKIPVTGDVPMGTEVTFEISGVRWQESAGTDEVVSLEGLLTYHAPSGEVRQSKYVIIDARVTWHGGRWVVPLTSNGGHTGEWAEPGTAAFNRAGWRIVTVDAWKGGVF